MIAYATNDVFVQAWIGVQDRLPRRLRAIYLMDAGNLRHEMELSGWKTRPEALRLDLQAPRCRGEGEADSLRADQSGGATLARGTGPGTRLAEVGGTVMTSSAKRLLLLAAGVLVPATAVAYASHNRYGGTTTHSQGSTTATSAWGGSATHTQGQGTSMSGAQGGSAYHSEGSGQTTGTTAYGTTATHYQGVGTTATNQYGTTATHAEGSPYYHTSSTAYHAPYPYPPPPAYYHPPTAVVVYPSSGCYNCAPSTGAAVAAGVVIGAAVASSKEQSNTAAATSSAYSSGYAAGSANTAAATSTAYTSGYSAGASTAAPAGYSQPGPGQPAYMMGATYATLPGGCITPTVNGVTYYQCGYTWFRPSYSAGGVQYTVVPPQQP